MTPRPLDDEEHQSFRLFEDVRAGNVAAVRTALKSLDLTPNSRDEFGNTILIIAAESNDRDMAKLAHKFGVDVNLANFSGNTALHVAAAHGEFQLISGVMLLRVKKRKKLDFVVTME